jgi:hypothetical protein
MAARDTGARPVSARALAMHSAVMRGGQSTHRARMGLGLTIGSIETHQMSARDTGELPVSVLALTLCNMHFLRAARTLR